MDTDAQPAAAPLLQWSSQAVMDVAAERRRQIEAERWTPEHDDEHNTGAIAVAGAAYALMAGAPFAENAYWYWERCNAAEHLWPWDRSWFKPGPPRRMLVKAAALLLAEIERLDRKADLKPNVGGNRP